MQDAEHSPEPEPKALSVTQLVRRMKNLLEVQVGEIWIEGEVSNLRRQASGHWYFSLKDDRAQISCAMFGAKKRPGADRIEDGAKVRVFAEATVYEARGQLQVVVMKADSVGAGDLQARLEKLKAKLQAEGLFDAERKQAIPRHPQRIGLITSASGAALQDMLNVLTRRAPWVQPVLMPVRVQGKGAEIGIARAIERMGHPELHDLPVCDVLIVGRGGGSLEDLWNFNEEVVARAIADCPIPVICAVGHEIDFTIADFVADLRAPTPSAAIELAVMDREDLSQRIMQQRKRMSRLAEQRIERLSLRIEGLGRGRLRDGDRMLREPTMRLDAARVALSRQLATGVNELKARVVQLSQLHRSHHPSKVLERRGDKLDSLKARLLRLTEESLQDRGKSLAGMRDLLRALGPESAFQRGFSITMDEEGRVVRSAKALSKGQKITSKFADGEVSSEVVDSE